jgi:16S rRNA processing protein RimM
MKVTIGKISKPHGVKGELKVLPDTFDDGIFKKLESVFIEEKTFILEYAKIANGYVILKLEGVDGMDAAEAFRNKVIQIEKSRRLKLPDGFHYISDLIGCGVYAGERRIGELAEVLQNGAADVYVVDGVESEIMFPAVESLLIRIDTDNKIIVLDEKRFGETAVFNEKK